MYKRIMLTILLLSSLSGCIQYKLIEFKAPVTVRGISVSTPINWSQLPQAWVLSDKATYWTLDGVILNHLMFFGEVGNGDKLFRSPNKEISMPEFRADMLPNEVQELFVSSLKNVSNGKIDISSKNLRPQNFGSVQGYAFDIDYTIESGLIKRGKALAAVHNDQLYLIVYLAPDVHYFEEYSDEVDKILSSATISTTRS